MDTDQPSPKSSPMPSPRLSLSLAPAPPLSHLSPLSLVPPTSMQCGGFTVHTPLLAAPPTTFPSLATGQSNSLTLPHTLNAEKQLNRLLTETSRFAVEFEVKSNGDCVSIYCSPGFFLKFAQPTFCDSSVGFRLSHPGYSFTMIDVTQQLDKQTNEQSRKVVLEFMCQDVPRELVVHVYNTRRHIMVQSGAIMPDRSPAATWFVRNVLHDHFISLARYNQDDITDFHNAIIAMASHATVSSSTSEIPACASCSKPLAGNCKPVDCSKGRCIGKMHTTCERRHTCTTTSTTAITGISPIPSSITSPSTTAPHQPPAPMGASALPPPPPGGDTPSTPSGAPRAPKL